MLDRARVRVPDGTFLRGNLGALPLPDDSADLVVSGLALCHVPALAPVMAEFARVLRPGGHLAVSDVHHEITFRGSVPQAPGPDGEPGLVPNHRHTPGDHLRAALPAGLQVRRCEEPGASRADLPPAPPAPADVTVTGWHQWPWSLPGLIPEAAAAAWAVPSTIVRHFRLGGPGQPPGTG